MLLLSSRQLTMGKINKCKLRVIYKFAFEYVMCRKSIFRSETYVQTLLTSRWQPQNRQNLIHFLLNNNSVFRRMVSSMPSEVWNSSFFWLEKGNPVRLHLLFFKQLSVQSFYKLCSKEIQRYPSCEISLHLISSCVQTERRTCTNVIASWQNLAEYSL